MLGTGWMDGWIHTPRVASTQHSLYSCCAWPFSMLIWQCFPSTHLHLHLHVLQGVEAVGHHLVRTVTAWDMSPRAAACSAVDPGSNKLFVHWSQTGSPRQGGGSDVAHTGVSVLVFNAQARIQQV